MRAEQVGGVCRIEQHAVEVLVSTRVPWCYCCAVQDQSSAGEAIRDCAVRDDGNLESLRYPTGRLRLREDPQPTPEKHLQWIGFIEALPGELRALVQDLSDRRLDTPYRPGGWTIRQVVHHLADSHMNGYIRTKLAMTEDVPTVKPFDEEAWAKLPDACVAPPEVSLRLLEALDGHVALAGQAGAAAPMHHPNFGTPRAATRAASIRR